MCVQVRDDPPPSLHDGYAFSWSGDYLNLQDIIDAVKHGHSINWIKVREEAWKHQPVEDAAQLVRLVTSCRNPKKCLEALSPENLYSLMEKATPDGALQLASSVIKHIQRSKVLDARNPYYMAIWTMIRYAGHTDNKQNLSLLMDDDLSPFVRKLLIGSVRAEVSEVPEDEMHNVLLESLKWAERYSHNLRVTNTSPDSSNLALAKLLGFASTQCRGSKADAEYSNYLEEMASLWSGSFAKLLLPPNFPLPICQTAEVIQNAMRHAPSKTQAAPEWPEPVQQLARVMQRRATSADVRNLWIENKELFLDHTNPSKPICTEFIPGIFCANRLEIEIQNYLLKSNCVIPEGQDIDQGRHLVAEALRHMAKEDLALVSSLQVF